jgi:hypothetical protein
MKFKFSIKTNNSLDDIKEEFIKSVTSFSKKYKVDLEIEILQDNNIKRLEIVPTYYAEGTSLIDDNTNAFHKAYLDKFVENEKLDLFVLEVE